jgi:nucleoside-diphosphate-sugar epimerase
MQAEPARSALVLGATGGAGHEVVLALLRHGWNVSALHRDPSRAAGTFPPDCPIRWIKGDAMRAADVASAVRGASLLFHGVNPPGYRRWRELAIPMLDNSIAAAHSADARLVFPGNVYGFGPNAWLLLSEGSPQHPKTKKGAVRVEMERMLADAARAGTRSLILRAGDFFGPHAPGLWFGAVMIKPGRPVGSITYPGRHAVGHAWAFLPDLAETVARLAELEHDLAAFEVMHFGGHWIEPGIEIARAMRRVVSNPDLPIRSFPWLFVYLAMPFSPLMRELPKMRYLWNEPIRLNNAKLVSQLGAEPHTPLDEAVRRTLIGLGCLPSFD